MLNLFASDFDLQVYSIIEGLQDKLHASRQPCNLRNGAAGTTEIAFALFNDGENLTTRGCSWHYEDTVLSQKGVGDSIALNETDVVIELPKVQGEIVVFARFNFEVRGKKLKLSNPRYIRYVEIYSEFFPPQQKLREEIASIFAQSDGIRALIEEFYAQTPKEYFERSGKAIAA
jgi:hypothetical protein